MPNIPGQIISELGEIGKQVGREVAKVPKDIAGQALESLGSSSGKKQGQQAQTTPQKPTGEAPAPQGPWQSIDAEKDKKTKEAIARAALEDLTRPKQQQKEPSVWEKIQMEEQKKKEMAAKQAASQQATAIPMSKSKRPRGDLYGIKAKKAGSEVGKNVRQD